MKRRMFWTELCYLFGILTIALGTALMERANFGVSMVVAPAYLMYLKLSAQWSFVTFGMAEYLFQAALLVLMALILRRFRLSDLFSFVTAVIYGFVLDACMALIALLPDGGLALRLGLYVLGMLFCALGVALMFRTYIAPEVYELFVHRVSAKWGVEISRFKTVYDLISCLLAVVMSFLFFGFMHFEGVRWGTLVCALVNGALIGWIGRALDRRFEFRDGLKLRGRFEG